MSMGQNKTVSRELWDARFLDLVLSLESRLDDRLTDFLLPLALSPSRMDLAADTDSGIT